MQGDDVIAAMLDDIIFIYFGEDLFRKTKNKRSRYHIWNKFRRCGKFLIQIRQLGSYSDILSLLKFENFDVIEATKKKSRYDVENRSFGAASLALHFGTSLKKLTDLTVKLVLRKKYLYQFHMLTKL